MNLPVAVEAARAVQWLALTFAVVAVVVAVAAVAVAWQARRMRDPVDELLARRLDLALDAGGMTTWMWDARSGALSWDARGDAVHGGTAPTTVDAWIALAHPDDRHDMGQALLRGSSAQEPFQVVHRFQRPDGEVRWLELRGEPVPGDDGEPLGTAGVVVDVTSARLAAQELAESRAAMEQILDMAPALAGEVPPDDVPAWVCQAAVDVFGCEACGIWSVEDAELRAVAHHPTDLVPADGARLAFDDLPALRDLLARRAPGYVSVSQLADEVLRERLGDAHIGSGVLMPVGGSSGPELCVALWWRDDAGPPARGPLAVMQRFADQVALALEQARTRAANDEVNALSETLQAGLLPALQVRDPDVRVHARSRPMEHRILLGGDFYDVLERPGGELAFVVGDVSGHGPAAAAVGAALRAAWRALVVAGNAGGPGGWLDGLGTTFASYRSGPEMLVTAFTGTISPDRTAAVVANAGHPTPMLLARGAVAPLDVPHGIALGVVDPGESAATSRVSLEGHWRLLLYTDGVIEIRTRRWPSRRLEQEGLAAWLGRRAGDLDDAALLDALLDHLDRVNVDPRRDDIALLLIGGDGPSSSGTVQGDAGRGRGAPRAVGRRHG